MVSATSIVSSIVAFILIDALWLGLVMKEFYRTQLMPIGRMADGGFAPIWWAASLVYVLLGVGVAVFVVPRAQGTVAAAALGALFGAVVYGVYDLTNYSTLAAWPAIVTIADIAWGTVACSVVSVVVFLLRSR